MSTEEVNVQYLEEIPPRVLTFLRGVGNSPQIRSILTVQGYDQAEHDLAWSLLHKASGYHPGRPDVASPGDPVVQDALHEIDAWDEPNFERIEAILNRAHPVQAAFVFANLAPAQGAGAIVTVTTLLDRLDALQNGKDRKATHKEDLAAIKLLEQRGYTPKVRQHLRDQIKVVQHGTTEVPVPTAGAQQEKERADYQSALSELHGWYKEWSTTARNVIKRKDYLIRLGLATRKPKPETPPAPAAAAASK